jgi:hypothetical protein
MRKRIPAATCPELWTWIVMSRKRYVMYIYALMGSNNNLIIRQSRTKREGCRSDYIVALVYLSLHVIRRKQRMIISFSLSESYEAFK